MKLKTRISAIFLLVFTLFTMLPMGAVVAFAEGIGSIDEDHVGEDAMEEIRNDGTLNSYKQGETQSFADDEYIGIPYEVTVYYDYAGKGAAVPGYMTVGATPVILYVVNANVERIGTDSDTDIIKSMIERGYAVVVLDYLGNAKAKSPELDWSAQRLRVKAGAGDYFTDKSVFPSGTYQDNVIVPAGYDILLNDVYFELDKHGTDGTLEKIVNVWNNDFRLYKKDTVVKWVHEDGSRKATQSAFDGSSPVWYADAAGKTVDAENGIYIKVKHTKAEVITDCVKADGSPLDLNLYFHAIYPTNPENEVPVMVNFSSAGYLMTGSNNVTRPQFQGFLFNGYAGVLFDYAWIPMGRNDHYGYFDGSSGENKSVTGDNQSYATYTFNSSQSATAGMRYLRYLALTKPETYKFNIDKVGLFGISKAAWMNQLGAIELREGLYSTEQGYTEAQVAELVNDKINGFYQQLWLPEHHGESRYDNGKTETYKKDGYTIDGGELQPWAVYGGKEISSGAHIIYSSAGAVVDYIGEGFAPQFITVNLRDEYNTGYGMQNILVNICRNQDIPALWYEADINHTFAVGPDWKYGVDIYDAFFKFSDYYLKDAPVSVTYTDPMNKSVISATSPITVKFIGEVTSEEIVKVTLTDGNGNSIEGAWESAYGNTEWTFIPYGLEGNTVHTLTVPAEMKGANGVPMGEAYVATFTTLPELGADFELNGGKTVSSAEGSFISFTVPAFAENTNRLKLRLRADGEAVNKLLVYAAQNGADTAGALLGSVNVSGAGYYEYDVTDYVMSHAEGDTVYFYVKTANESGNVQTYEETFDSGKGDFTTSSYSKYTYAQEIAGETAVKIIRTTNEGKFGGDHYYYNSAVSLSNNKLINGGKAVTKADLGRTFLITVRVYDTVSRPVRFMMNNVTKQADLLLDYDRVYYTYQTKANEWCEFTIPYTVYEAEYGITSQVKQFQIQINPTGDTEMPVYIDNVSVCEVFTDVTVGAASLVMTTVGELPYKAPASDMPFTHNGIDYATLNEVLDASKSDGVITLNRDYIITSKEAYNIVACKNLVIDLNGYVLYAENGTRSPFQLGSINTNDAFFTLRNGTVVLGDMPLFAFNGSKSSGSGKNISVTVENVYITTAEDATLTTVMANGTVESGVKVYVDFALKNVDIDLKRENLPDRNVNILSSGNSDLSVKYAVTGGTLTLNSTHEISFCDGVVGVYADENGEYFKAYVCQWDAAPVASFKKDGEYSSFTVGEVVNGYKLYTVEASAYSTAYGAIPDKYADASVYPIVVFAGEAFIGATDSVYTASTIAKSYMDNNGGATVEILLRADIICTKGTDKLCAFNGTLVFDMDGHTVIREGAVFETMMAPDYKGSFDTTLTVKNGTFSTRNGQILVFEVQGNVEKQFYITFENITFEVAENASSFSHFFLRCWATTGTGKVNADIDIKDCVFDITGAVGMTPRMFDVSNNGVNADITVTGGKILADAESIGNVNWYSLSASGDSLNFVKDGNGDYTALYVPAGTAPALSMPTPDGVFSYSTLVGKDNGFEIYTLTNDTVPTKYGAIPSSSSANTFVLFMNGKFITGVNDWNAANKQARQVLDANKGATVTILMRKDHIAVGSMSASDRICFMNGTVQVDLDGHKLISKNTLFEGGVPSSYTGNYDTAYKVMNGYVLIGAGNVFASESRGNTDKRMDLVFENVTFGINAATYTTNRNKLFLCYGDQDAYVGNVDFGFTFNDCVFDLRGITVAFSVFSFDSVKNVTPDIAINGGNIIADSFDNVTLYKLSNTDSRFVFGKGENGAYTTLTVPAAYTLPVIGATKDNGKGVIFANGVADGDNKTYTLTESEQGTKYGVIPEEYASASEYPFALFANGKFNTAKKTWGEALNAARSYLNSNKGKTVLILMRADHTNTASSDYLGRFMGTVNIDLNGYTIVRGNGRSLFEAGTKNMTETESGYVANINVFGGTVLALNTSSSNSGHILTYQTYVNFDKTINISFNNVTFGVSSAVDTAKGIYSVITRSWGASGGATGIITSELKFTDCTFDFSGENGTWLPTSDTRLVSTSAGKNSQNISVIFEGGKYIGNVSKVTLTDVDSSDSVKYLANSEGRYTELDITAGNPPSAAQNTDIGTMYFVRESWKNVDGVRVYHYELGVKLEGYCTVPYKYYADIEKYPFIVVQNGGFVAACTDWTKATAKAADYLDNDTDADKVVTILLRRDYTANESSDQLSRIRGKLIIDFGGHTFTANKTFLEMEARHIHTTTVVITNGTLLSARTGSGSLIALNRNNIESAGNGTYFGNAHKDAYITFENVTIGLKSGATTTNFILVAWYDDSKSAEETYTVYLNLDNCVIDLKTVKNPNATNIFNALDGDGYIDLKVTMNGGKILAYTMSNVTVLRGNETGDFFAFGKYDGKYTTLSVVSGNAPKNEFDTADGKMYFAATEVEGEYVLAAHTHSYEENVTAPTCTADGYTTYTCTCGESYTDNVVTATGHKYDNDFDADCNNCGEIREVEIITSGEVSRKIFWAFEDGVLTVTGRGKIKNFSAGVTPWSHLADKITKVVIGEGLTYIGSSAFYCCANIESVELPESLTAMGNYVFYGCSALKSITIPEAVTEIGKYSFRRSGLETIDFAIGYGWSAGDRDFTIADITSGGHRFISKSYYKQTWVRNTEAAEEALDPNYVAGGIMHTDVIWELTYTDESKTNMKLTIRGNGAMADFGTAGAPWYAYWEKITEIEIQEGVTTVGRCAFYGLKFVRKATVADSVTAIGDYGFYMCRLLKSIELPEGITIGTDAFVKTGIML